MRKIIKKKKGFTLVELIATIVVLGIILAITVPVITGVIGNSAKKAFESDAKMVLKGIDYKKLSNTDFDPEVITKDNIKELLGISEENYENLSIYIEDNVPEITIIGTGKWEGLIACGTAKDMLVVRSIRDCNIDMIPPVITIIGDNPFSMHSGQPYSDAGATAVDERDGDITDKIVVTGTVSPNIPGVYTITYTVADMAMNETTATRTVNVIDVDSPMITFDPNGNSIYGKSRSTVVNVTDKGGLDNDSLKYLWTKQIEEPSSELFNNSFVNGSTLQTPSGVSGSYYLWVTATDISNNKVTTRSNVFNLDNEKPVITINGSNNITINKGNTYSDLGATATDNIDTTVPVTATGSVLPNTVGTYTITYTSTDSSGNQATPVIRTINVVDATAPVITITGSNPVTLEVKTPYSDAGATAIDDVDGDVTSSIITTGTVNPNLVGTYTIIYTVTDTAGNKATATRTVNVVDTTKPTIAFGTNGSSTYAKSRSTTVTVSDNVSVNTTSLKYLWNTSTSTPSEASITNSFTNGGTINTPAGVTGDYYLWILAKDTSGNTTIQRTNVFKLDNTIPVITINPTTVTITEGTVYTDAGVTASDAHSGINGSVTWTGSFNPNVPGTYTLTYTVNDKAGNVAASKTRTVIVLKGDYNASKGVNYPVLASGMTPVKWDGSNWVNTTESDSDWYDYSAKKWANAKTADGSFWVWIPRYIYKISSGWHSSTAGTINIQFTQGINDNWNSSSIGNIDVGTSANSSNNKWTNHPAFTFGTKELPGFWIAKFEAVGSINTIIQSRPDGTLAAIAINGLTIEEAFVASRNMETKSQYGWGTSGDGIDTHLIKNIEWGAVAYLSKSIYGKNTEEIWINNTYAMKAGCSGSSVSAERYIGDGCQAYYHATNGVKASTTGTIYGVYDMSGGADEFVSAYLDNNNFALGYSGSSVIYAASKYKDVYNVGTSDTSEANYALLVNYKGDALYEISASHTGSTSWYGDQSNTFSASRPWLTRGGYYGSGSSAGAFNFTNAGGGRVSATGFRPVLLVGEGL